MATFEGQVPDPPPRLQPIRSKTELDAIRFEDGVAFVDVDARLLPLIRFKNEVRTDDERLRSLCRSIRHDGYTSWSPILARIGQKGKWVVVDGGHRLTAIRRVQGEWWTNLFRQKVVSVQFLLFTTDRSWRKAKRLAETRRSVGEHPLPEDAPPEPADAS